MEQLALQNENPALYQNLFRSSYESMPADTATRLRANSCWVEDIPILREHGWEHKANELQAEVDEGTRMIMEKKIAESQAKQKADQERIRAYQELPLAAKPLDPEAIAQARRQWGITGQPIF